VFRPERVRERSTYGDPHQLAEGMETVIVNGVPALLDGTATGRRAGQVLDR
jgi:N-acyl-D-amino-acid deacylase